MKEFDNNLESYLQDAIQDIIGIMKIKSVHGKAEENAPFGTETTKALKYALDLCQKFGFDVHYGPNNEYGYADFGSGEKIFGIISHLDVVPAGDLTKWAKSPWEPIIENNELYGRGALDDKGPAIINIYAVKYLKDHGFNPQNYRIRLIFGLTEETTWESITSYLKNEKEPDLAYTPDGQWPLIYAEKTIVNFDIIGPGVNNLKMHGGEAYNVVCDVNEIISEYNKEIKQYFDFKNYEYVLEEDKLVAKGKAAHASIPTTGISAIMNSIEALKKLDKFNNISLINYIYDNFNDRQYNMNKVFPNWKDESGEVSVNIGMIRINNNEQRVCLDARVPVTYTKEQIEEAIKTSIKDYKDLRYEITDLENAKYIKKDEPFLQKMLQVYREITGEHDAEPLAIGGGTYARAMKNCIAFGACKSMDLMHNVNERISIDELRSMLKIYIKALSVIVD